MTDRPHHPKFETRTTLPAVLTTSGQVHTIEVPVRYFGWRVSIARALSRERATGTVELAQLALLPKGVSTCKIEVWERGVELLLGTFEGPSTEGHFEARTFEPAQLQEAREDGFHCTCKVGAPGLTGEVPLKGHQDWTNESWDLYVKVYADGVSLSADSKCDAAHVWIDWPAGRVIYPSLGSPALVPAKGKGEKWLQVLVETDEPLPKGAEKFLLRSQLRLFPWFRNEMEQDEDARQKALLCRTFALYRPKEVAFQQHGFERIGSDVDTNDDAFPDLRLAWLQHSEHANKRDEPKDRKPGKRTVYKVKLMLTGSLAESGLYNLLWMNKEDFDDAHAAAAIKEGKAKRVDGDEDVLLRVVEDQRLRKALLEATPRSTGKAPFDPRVLYVPGPVQERGDAWRLTQNQLPRERPTADQRVRAHHPVCVIDREELTIGHLTDLHLEPRFDVMAQNPIKLLPQAAVDAGRQQRPDFEVLPLGKLLNDYNATAFELAGKLFEKADVLVLTGDLIDYGRGFAGQIGPNPTPEECWAVGAYSDGYVEGRNWMLFYDFLMRLYAKYRKPIFTVLGNHDYRTHPYPLYPGAFGMSPYDTIAGDMNLTIYEAKAIFGEWFQTSLVFSKEHRDGSDVLAEAHGATTGLVYGGPAGAVVGGVIATQETMLHSDDATVAWYDLAINPWRDRVVTFGRQALLLLDWDQVEDNIQVQKFGFHLSRAKQFMTPVQEAIYKRWLKLEGPSGAKQKGPWKVLCCHPTLACHSPALGIPDSEARRGRPLEELWWGSMGATVATGEKDDDNAARLRGEIAQDLARGIIAAVLSGHSHMNGAYSVEKLLDPPNESREQRAKRLQRAHVQMLGPVYRPWGTDEKPWDGPAAPAASFTASEPIALVTSCGGPLGEWSEREGWTRRAPPSGNLVAPAGRVVSVESVVSRRLSTRPRRCVYDLENRRIRTPFRSRRKVTSRMHGERDELDVSDDLPYRFVVRSDGALGFFTYRLDPDDTTGVLNRIVDLLWLAGDDCGWTSHRSSVTMATSAVAQAVYAAGPEEELRSFQLSRGFLEKMVQVKGRSRLYVVVGYGTGSRDDWAIELSSPHRFRTLRAGSETEYEEWMGFDWEEWADLSTLPRK